MMGLTGVNMTDFSNRLKYQKLIYLAQATGINIGYGYSWYLRGPYAPHLAQTLFNIDENPSLFKLGDTIKFKSEPDIQKRIDKLTNILGDHIEDPNYLEVLASLHYLQTTLPSNKNSCDELSARLFKLKPGLKNVEDVNTIIKNAYKDLKKLN